MEYFLKKFEALLLILSAISFALGTIFIGSGCIIYQIYFYLRYGFWIEIKTYSFITKYYPDFMSTNFTSWAGVNNILKNLFEAHPSLFFLWMSLFFGICSLVWGKVIINTYRKNLESGR